MQYVGASILPTGATTHTRIIFIMDTVPRYCVTNRVICVYKYQQDAFPMCAVGTFLRGLATYGVQSTGGIIATKARCTLLRPQ